MAEFDTQLQRWYEGEIAGAAFFDALAGAAQNDGEAEKWRLLAGLESSMAERLSATCAAASIALPEAPSTQSSLAYARKMAGDPWRTSMEGLVPPLREAVAGVRAEAGQAPAEHAGIASDYVAHEEALLAFATAEATGEDGSDAVRSLLQQWSESPLGAGRSATSAA